MTLPSWTDTKLGAKKRAALWLVTEVGEGGIFIKEDVRTAFPGLSQIDRRVRELRQHGWRIDTNREDASLGQHEQRLVAVGEPVWEEGKGSLPSTSLTETQRRELLSKDGNYCRSCGITPGAVFYGTYESAQLDIARRPVKKPDGSTSVEPVSECNKCRVGGKGLTADLPGVLAGIAKLSAMERGMLVGWIKADEREFGMVERLWADYRTLPASSRDEVREALGTP
ncbi:hypothetical protein DEJ50_11960 [Streptomyces venezuelae]|uniref:HNH endonuclease n=1 Tax=Streptomyces venezuelae TaxID=54571 RepID=A0A5P2CZX2_STRVZ|nr:hypothetical protein [Streptomyces venezuelae]QES48425.1 hypothetical protein DEJ50_11960 [Streptomyces venezuelae]